MAQWASTGGWRRVLVADGDASTLTALVRDVLPTDAGGLLHLSGEEVKPGISEALIAAGYDYRRVVVYRATAAAMLAPRTIQVLSENRMDAVLLFSPRTAAIFRDLVGAAGLDDHLGGTIGLCLSDDVAARISALSWRDIVVAPRRSQEALLAHLESLSGAC
jgi:uroporphyrinogen-III synthase